MRRFEVASVVAAPPDAGWRRVSTLAGVNAERTLEPAAGGCRVTDRITFEPRLAFTGPVFGPIFRLVFRWRHHRLGRAFGMPRE